MGPLVAGSRARLPRALLLVAAIGCVAGPARAPMAGGSAGPTFVDEAGKRGIELRYRADLRRAKMIATMGGGVAAADYDNDGDVDLYLLTGLNDAKAGTAKRGNALYRNRGDGTFEDVGEAAGVALRAWSMGAVFADIDGDGWLDLYVTCLGPNHHFRNRGDGTFEDMGEKTGIADPRFGSGAAFADFDRDGDLDLVLVNYLQATVADEMAAKQFVIRVPADYQGQPSAYYENQGNGTFVERTARAGIDNKDGKGLGVRAFDADGDGLVDVYIANDTVPNKLYRNQGGGVFEDVGLMSGAAVAADGKARAGMGIALGDADGDGREELFVTNFSSEPNSLFHNEGAGLYSEATDATLSRASLPFVAWGTSFFDYDLDGDLDLVVANGHLVPRIVRLFGRISRAEDKRYLEGAYKAPVHLFRNDGGKWTDMAGQAGDLAALPVAARGLAVADLDGDGDLDVVVSARDQEAPVFINQGKPAGHWLGVAPRALGKNPFAIGARVEIEAGGKRQVRTICAGSSYIGSEPPVAHFGLGAATVVDKVTVSWPAGSSTTLSTVAADRVLVVRQEP